MKKDQLIINIIDKFFIGAGEEDKTLTEPQMIELGKLRHW